MPFMILYSLTATKQLTSANSLVEVTDDHQLCKSSQLLKTKNRLVSGSSLYIPIKQSHKKKHKINKNILHIAEDPQPNQAFWWGRLRVDLISRHLGDGMIVRFENPCWHEHEPPERKDRLGALPKWKSLQKTYNFSFYTFLVVLTLKVYNIKPLKLKISRRVIIEAPTNTKP